MTLTIPITLLIESGVVVGFALWRKKPLIHILLSSFMANLLMRSLLWIVLNLFPYHYLPALLITEVCIVAIEALIMFFFYRYNQLKSGEAALLSLAMNLASFSIGWFLAV